MDRLVSIADDWAAPNSACIPNPEKQLDLGVFTTQQMADRLGTRDAAFSTEAWLFDNVDWSPIIKWSMMLQIFPLEVPASADWNGCKIHAHKKGFSCVTFTFGSYDVNGVQPQPSDYPLKTPYQIYTADDLTYCYPHYEWWGPTGTFQPCLTVKPPISEEDCPYTGPYYPIGSKYKPTRGKTVKALKIAMNRLGCGRFLNPSIYFGAQLKSALFRFQIASGISPTGNYGRKTWVALRAATTANGEYAFNDECLTLIQEDAVS
jgi:peptidoglycan hydrolase-like protein with peptidoglycan-binding domain